MVLYKWVIPGVLATSSMPSVDVLDEVASLFKSVVILAEDHELEYDPGLLAEKSVRVLQKPIPDFNALNLIDLHEIIDFIEICEKPVLVHCSSGRGRSGVVAVAYLMASLGLSYKEALYRARSIEPKYVETLEQHRVLQLYEELLKTTPKKLLSSTIEIGERVLEIYGKGRVFGRGVGHASKVLELSVELIVGIEKTQLLSLSKDTKRALYVAAILHDIGVCKLKPGEPDDIHRKYSYELISEYSRELDMTCNCRVAEKAAIIALLHGKRDPIPPGLDKETLLSIGIIRVADGLDFTLEQSVRSVSVKYREPVVLVEVFCDEKKPGCLWNIRRAREKKQLLESVLGIEVTIEHAY